MKIVSGRNNRGSHVERRVIKYSPFTVYSQSSKALKSLKGKMRTALLFFFFPFLYLSFSADNIVTETIDKFMKGQLLEHVNLRIIGAST